jgi:hypothetical protein
MYCNWRPLVTTNPKTLHTPVHYLWYIALIQCIEWNYISRLDGTEPTGTHWYATLSQPFRLISETDKCVAFTYLPPTPGPTFGEHRTERERERETTSGRIGHGSRQLTSTERWGLETREATVFWGLLSEKGAQAFTKNP